MPQKAYGLLHVKLAASMMQCKHLFNISLCLHWMKTFGTSSIDSLVTIVPFVVFLIHVQLVHCMH